MIIESESALNARCEQCPFCGDHDFDAIGLKIHFERGYCDAYERLPSSWEEEKERRLTDPIRLEEGTI